jgi:hypothetical protein
MFIPNLASRNIALPTSILQLSESVFRHYPSLSLLAITAGCRSIVSLPQLSNLLEQCITAFIEAHAPFRGPLLQFLTPSPLVAAHMTPRSTDSHWYRIAAALQVPELMYSDFVTICLEQGRLNTLHTIALQRLQASWNRGSLWIVLDTDEQKNNSALAAGVMTRDGRIPRPMAWPAPPVSALEPHPLQMLQAQIDQLAGWCNVAKTAVFNPQIVDDDKTGDLPRVLPGGTISHDVSSIGRGADRYHEAYKLIPIWRTLLHWQSALSSRGKHCISIRFGLFASMADGI